jgi:membrane-bound lytic murein transglycosylase D
VKATRRARLTATWAGSLALLASVASSFAAPVARAADAPARSPRPARAASGSKGAGARTAARVEDAGGRRAVVRARAPEDVKPVAETEELVALRDAERDIFWPVAPAADKGGPPDGPPELRVVLPREGGPQVFASGVPPVERPVPSLRDTGEITGDLGWLAGLEMPDLPVRWDERVIQYIEFFRDDPRGHAMFANLFRHSGRFRDMMGRELRRKSLPEDLVWVSMIESGFDPAARSSSGAGGLWQFMPETGKIYGLTIDRWLDQRYSPEVATSAAADLLGDLHRRLGSWELALAAYNMGYAGLAAVVRRYNTNDFWSLARTEGTLPWQTTLYVPKILAAAVVAHNLATFGFGDIALDAPFDADQVDVPPAMSLALVARGAGCDERDVEGLNPELRAGRTPPAEEGEQGAGRYTVRVPLGKGSALAQALTRQSKSQPPVDRYVVRFGESLEAIAAAHKTTPQRLVELNAIAPGEIVRGGTTLLVPRVDTASPAAPSGGAFCLPVLGELPAPADRPSTPSASGHASPTTPATTTTVRAAAPRESVVVPSDEFVYPGRRRVFYRVLVGDAPATIAGALGVPVDDLLRWNGLDPSASLQEGMTLQAFVAPGADLSRVAVIPEASVHVVAVGSEEFFAPLELAKGRRRVILTAKAGETLESIGRRFDVPPRTMEWINRRGRADVLEAGETVVVYVPAPAAPAAGASAVAASNGPAASGPLPAAPQPDRLP